MMMDNGRENSTWHKILNRSFGRIFVVFVLLIVLVLPSIASNPGAVTTVHAQDPEVMVTEAPTATPEETPAPTDTPTATPEPTLVPTPTPGDTETISFIVRLVKGINLDAQQQVIERNGGVETSAVPVLRMHFIEVPETSADEVMQRYQSDPQVLSIERDKMRQAEGTPSDPSYPDQWALPQIGWDSVFGSVNPSGSAVVAVLDTGIDASHPDLNGIVLPGHSAFEGSDAQTDRNGHGTEMAGIVAARTDNGTGVAGVAYAGVSLLPVQVLSANGTGLDSDIINGIVWATDNGANVILMAFSNSDYSPALQDAIDYAWDNGVTLVAAAGNNGSSTVTYPAGDRGVMGVSATDPDDALASFSGYGQAVFLAAPGVDVMTTDKDGGYGNVTGTSASAAIVAGAAAFMKAVDPGLTNGVIVYRLARTAAAVGTQEQTGNGRLDMAGALNDTGTDFIQPAGAAPLGNGGPYVGPYVAAATIAVTTNQNWSAIGAGTTDTINVSNGATLTIDVTNAQCANLNLGRSSGTTGNGTLSFSASSSVVTVSTALTIGATGYPGSINMTNGGTLKIGNTITVTNLGTWTSGTGTVEHSRTNTQTIVSTLGIYNNLTTSGSNTKTLGGAVTVNGVLTIGSGTTLDVSTSNYALNVAGYWTNNGTFTKRSGTVTLNGTGTQTIGGSATTTFNTLTINKASGSAVLGIATTTTNFTMTAGTFDAATYLLTATTPTFTAGTLRVGASTWAGNYSFAVTEPAGATIEYYATGAQTVNNVNTYGGNLALSGSSAKTLGTSTTSIGGNLTLSGAATTATVVGLSISGNLVIGDGTTFTAAGFALTVTGTTTVGGGSSGNLTISSATGAKLFTGLVTISANGSWTNTSANSPVGFRGGITNNGTFNAGTGVHTFSINSQALTGTFSIPSVTVTSPTVLTNNNTLTVGTALIGTGGLTQATSATLNIGGTSTITTLTATNTGNTVNYTGAAQTINSNNYYHLTLSGSGTDVLQTGTTTISGNLTLSGTVSTTGVTGLTIGGTVTLGSGTTFNGGSFTHNVASNWTNNGGTFTPGTGTVTFTGTGAQAVSGTVATTFYNLAITNSAGVSLSSVNATISGTLTLTSGTFTVGANTLTLNGPTIAGTPSNLSTSSSSSLVFGGSSTGVNVPSSVTALNNLTINNANGITLNSSPTINGTLTLTSGKINTGAYTLILAAISSISGGSASSYVNGKLQKVFNTGNDQSFTFPIGDVSTYSSVDLASMNVHTAGNITVSTTAGEHPQIASSGIDSTRSVNRYWTLTAGGGFAVTYKTTFNYLTADVDGGATASSFIVQRYSSSVWTSATVSGTPTNTATTVSGQTGFGDFAIGDSVSMPTISAVGLYQTDHTTSVTDMNPQTEYALKVTVNYAGTLANLSTVAVTIFYKATTPIFPTDVPTSGNTQTAAILTCTVGTTPTWSIAAGAGTTWSIVSANCVQPTLTNTTGDFWFHFKPGKVATAAIGQWYIYAIVTDKNAHTGDNHQDSRTMNWYGEIIVNTSIIDFGTIELGSDFSANSKTGISVTYICNGSYSQQVKSNSPWSGSGNLLTLNTGGSPAEREFSLKADDTALLGSAVIVSTDYVTIGTGTQTTESGNTHSAYTLWIKLGATGIPAVLYSGTIYYGIAR